MLTEKKLTFETFVVDSAYYNSGFDVGFENTYVCTDRYVYDSVSAVNDHVNDH